MSRFIDEAKKIIADQSKGKFTKEKLTNKKLEKYLFLLFKNNSAEKIDENDITKYEQFKYKVIFIIHCFMSETYIETEENVKIKILKLLTDDKYVNGINILDTFNSLKSDMSHDKIILRKKILSIIKSKPDLDVNIIFDKNNNIIWTKKYFMI